MSDTSGNDFEAGGSTEDFSESHHQATDFHDSEVAKVFSNEFRHECVLGFDESFLPVGIADRIFEFSRQILLAKMSAAGRDGDGGKVDRKKNDVTDSLEIAVELFSAVYSRKVISEIFARVAERHDLPDAMWVAERAYEEEKRKQEEAGEEAAAGGGASRPEL